MDTRAPVLGDCNPRDLVTPRRLDLAVKWRFFKNLTTGDDPDAWELYRWHIRKRSGARMEAGLPTDRWKRTLEEYTASARQLYDDMLKHGFDGAHRIPVDVDGELLNGSHRVACALAIGLDSVVVEFRPERAWAPPWDYHWFRHAGMEPDDLSALLRDWATMKA